MFWTKYVSEKFVICQQGKPSTKKVLMELEPLSQSLNNSVQSRKEYGRQRLLVSLLHAQKCVTTQLLTRNLTHQLLVAPACLNRNEQATVQIAKCLSTSEMHPHIV